MLESLFILGIGSIGLIVGHHFYKMHHDASYIDKYCIEYLRHKYQSDTFLSNDKIREYITEILHKHMNTTNEVIATITSKNTALCIGGPYKRILIDDAKIFKEICINFGHSCTKEIIKAYILGLLEHERTHLRQMQEDKKFSYNISDMDIKKYNTDPLEIEAYREQLKAIKNVF